ncbi:SDR family oxidoreductase [Novacetimonas pomaceti]|uniref:NAD-dependent dehydratase n=1 Tax=Novacetimonas pomaceti TaxID=2021998 RepID=A0ABX5P5V4_9PROT|nr:SDR family oxidoreductase [Novacetimonas pomaceti]PYD48153.1 NAD-dependent dehydratase [Novacetimonas pomaceti]
MSHRALVVGATGIVGQNLANRLVAEGWSVYGLARRVENLPGTIIPVTGDALDPSSLRQALAGLEPTHVFFTTWTRRATEKENCVANSTMIRNVFEALPKPQSLVHGSLVTGLKHYLGPFEAYAQGAPPQTPFREVMPRLDLENFYYNQEDVLFEAARRFGFSWTVHRPHTVIGYAIGNLMNMGTTLAVYATLCRETGLPFVFPGSPMQWNGLTDVTDARQLASQILWAASSPAGRNEAFNVVNGDVFRWNWLWPELAAWFGIEAAAYPGHATSLERMLSGKEADWTAISEKYGLREKTLHRLASAWHTDADLGRPVECVTDMSKSRKFGFTGYRYTPDSFFDLFERLSAEGYIPGRNR